MGRRAQPDKIRLADVKFESIFGTPKDSSCLYCLLGSGFFRAPKADNTDSLINNWIAIHPNATLTRVSSLKDKMKMVYCWVIDNGDTLNTFLIENGCYPGGTMVGAKKNTSISEVYISDHVYSKFIEQLKVAEAFARQNKSGIWAKNDLAE